MKCTHVLGRWSTLWAGLLLLKVSANEQDGSSGSGSGDNSYLESIVLCPSSTIVVDYISDAFADKTSTFKVEATINTPKTTKPVPTILPTPKILTVYIEISLMIALEDYYLKPLNYEVLNILQKFLPADFTTLKRAVNEKYEIIVTLDEHKSSNHTSFLQAYIVNSVTREEESEATTQFFSLLASESATFIAQLEAAINISVVDVKLVKVTSNPTETPSTSLNWWDILFIVLGCTAIAVCAVLIALACCCRWFSRRREEEEKEGLLTGDPQQNDTEVLQQQPSVNRHLRNRVDQDARRVARVGFQSRVQVQSHPLTQVELENLILNPATLRSEYRSIPSNLVSVADIPPGAEEKNRYRDILPNPQTRVSLFLKFAESNSDYINANYIRGYHDAGRAYIATQGPLQWTVDDFWRMVWEQKSSVIVMVTGLEERRTTKCSRYWPEGQESVTAAYGDLDVTLKMRTTSNPHYTVSHFHVRHRQKLVSREVTHFWFRAWPDHGVPTATEPALDFLMNIRQYTQEVPGPIVVHCSAGIGRTGVFIGADIGMTQLESEGEVDILKIVSTMRQDRGGMVQTEQQYVFLHQLLLSYAHRLNGQSVATS